MKTIIAATDFSIASVNAAHYAAALSVSIKAKLVLYHAAESNTYAAAEPGLNMDDYLFNDSFRKLELLKDDLIKFTGSKTEIDVKLRFGTMRAELEQLCYEESPALIVLSATSKEKIERLLSGSNTLSLCHSQEIPVLLVPADAIFKPISKIAITTDLKDVFETAPLSGITRLLQLFTASVDIVHIITKNYFQPAALPESIALQTHFKEYSPQFIYISNELLHKGVEEYIQQNNPDILIIVPKRHGLFYKSQSKELLLHPGIPLVALAQQ